MGNDPGRHWTDTLPWAAIIAIAGIFLIHLWHAKAIRPSPALQRWIDSPSTQPVPQPAD